MRKLVLMSLLLVSAVWLLSLPLVARHAVAQEQVLAEVEAPEEEAEEVGRTVQDWYAMGGWIMHGILGCSILTLALVLERVWALRRNGVIPRSLLAKLHDHMRQRDVSQILTLCGSSETSIARVLRAGLLHFDHGLGSMQDAVETAGAHEATLLRRNLPMLAALANIATMMGLLGTVLGMIESFDLIAKTGTGDARVVAGGIFQALVTTAAGLIVGITAIGFHSFLRRKVEVLEGDLDEISFRMLEQLSLVREQPEPAEPGAAQLAPAEA
ncbi:MAG: MotA/TolQ/ExbB proton channel family protein [Deltaproteobacteria bacterium]|nr:MAG: MotA/TolQ/ExbB proton channel family protein [Deltaproteobacteria bacterium]